MVSKKGSNGSFMIVNGAQDSSFVELRKEWIIGTPFVYMAISWYMEENYGLYKVI